MTAVSPKTLAIMAVLAGFCGVISQSTAAPSANSKTEIVPFQTAPFPYDGLPPGQDKPFFDIEQDGRRGHTSLRGGIYWEDTTYSDRSVLLHVPKGFDPGRAALLIVFFHGNFARLERDVQNRQQVPRQILESGLNAVLVAPQFAVNAADSSAGRFYEAGAFRGFLDEASSQLARSIGNGRTKHIFEALPVLLIAYSGGYMPAAWCLHHGGARDRVRGLVLLDALYAEIDKFADWIEWSEAAFFFSAYSRSAREENINLQRLLGERGIDFRTALPDTLTPRTVAFLATGEDVVHGDFVTRAWTDDPLVTILRRIPGYPRGRMRDRTTR